MEYFVKGYLILLTLSAVVLLPALLLRAYKSRRLQSTVSAENRILVIRESFHIVLGLFLFWMLAADWLGAVATLSVSAVLLISFELFVVVFRRSTQPR